MMGCVLGMFVVFGFLKMSHRRRWHRDGGPWGGGRRRRGRGRGRGRRGAVRVAGEMFKRKLDIDEDQEDIVDLALKDLQEAGSEFAGAMRDSREDLSKAFEGDEVDSARLAAVFEQHDAEIARARRKAISALTQVHAVLDEEQRSEAAAWLAGLGHGRRWA